jgi:peptide/nickel transport system substrate-binding protein
MQKTNPEILQVGVPQSVATPLNPRNDVKPFNDIRVREAMQMAIDLPDIASNYYGGTCSPDPSTLTSNYMTGWGFPYDQWPQNLKDEYAYNPTAAKELLAAAGYPNGFQTDIVASSDSDMELLQIIQSYFSAVGINMSIQIMDPASWTSFVRTSHKEDQMSTRPVGSIGNTLPPTQQFDFYLTNTPVNYCMVSDPVYDAFHTEAMAATSIDGIKQALRDANEYVAQQHFNITLLQPNNFCLYQPWLKGYNGQAQSIGEWGTVGTKYCGFFAARFWINKNP